MMEVINTAIRTELRGQGSKIEVDRERIIAEEITVEECFSG